nr:methylenetetrahydrofolate reductase C-terminal domain-containing protein [Desulfobulbaceae bacterium]
MVDTSSSTFRESLFNDQEFTLTLELVPSRGGRSKEHSRILALAKEAALDGRLQAVSITENAGGHPALSPGVLGVEIQALGLNVISHFSCKDKNRNQIESLLFGWDRQCLHDLLIISGDYPRHGYLGKPKPVFDLDSVHVIDLINRMNNGRFDFSGQASNIIQQTTSFLKGIALSPFKLLHSELSLQYLKLHNKAAVGADYIITQLGFDARKFHEVLVYLKEHEISLPVLGNVFIPNVPVIELIYRGEIPGCIITDELYQTLKQEAGSSDRGKKSRLTRAAKLLAVLKGLGYDGAHIGGPGLSFKDIDYVISHAETFTDSWQDLVPELSYWPASGAYYYEKDNSTGLNTTTPKKMPWKGKQHVSLGYGMSKVVHDCFFEPKGSGYNLAKKICLALNDKGYDNLLMQIEHFSKILLFGCKNCGDCRIAEFAFLCPQSGCAKYLLNGPCGGSRDGWCEVYPNRKRCFYVLVYERLKAHNLTEQLRAHFQQPRDWSKNNTSSWLNFFIDSDNISKG